MRERGRKREERGRGRRWLLAQRNAEANGMRSSLSRPGVRSLIFPCLLLRRASFLRLRRSFLLSHSLVALFSGRCRCSFLYVSLCPSLVVPTPPQYTPANNAIIISLSLFSLLFAFSLSISPYLYLSFCLGSSLYSPQTILCVLSAPLCVAVFFSWSLTRSKPCDECLISTSSAVRQKLVDRSHGIFAEIEVRKVSDLFSDKLKSRINDSIFPCNKME